MYFASSISTPFIAYNQCTIMWDGTDNVDAIHVTDRSPPPHSPDFMTGSFVRSTLMFRPPCCAYLRFSYRLMGAEWTKAYRMCCAMVTS